MPLFQVIKCPALHVYWGASHELNVLIQKLMGTGKYKSIYYLKANNTNDFSFHLPVRVIKGGLSFLKRLDRVRQNRNNLYLLGSGEGLLPLRKGKNRLSELRVLESVLVDEGLNSVLQESLSTVILLPDKFIPYLLPSIFYNRLIVRAKKNLESYKKYV